MCVRVCGLTDIRVQAAAAAEATGAVAIRGPPDRVHPAISGVAPSSCVALSPDAASVHPALFSYVLSAFLDEGALARARGAAAGAGAPKPRAGAATTPVKGVGISAALAALSTAVPVPPPAAGGAPPAGVGAGTIDPSDMVDDAAGGVAVGLAAADIDALADAVDARDRARFGDEVIDWADEVCAGRARVDCVCVCLGLWLVCVHAPAHVLVCPGVSRVPQMVARARRQYCIPRMRRAPWTYAYPHDRWGALRKLPRSSLPRRACA